ncbi:MAG TPA: ribosome recycling factor [Dissulfurispiraceae bacterium]|jgi:ribosome recycling factor|nr:ribosome recycling factor [Dissulfurispiraceae bacterium]
MQELKKKAQERMNSAVESLKKDFGAIRTGRASLVLLDGIKIDYYGTVTPLNQVATLGIPESRLITIQPWEQRLIPDIEKAIMKSDLGLTPSNDGKTIKLNIPQLTEERRKQLVKVVKKRTEEARVAVRNIRRDILEETKRIEKEKHISEDEVKRFQDEVQKLTDSFITKVEEVLQHKEREIMEV